MKVTEVKIKLAEGNNDRLLAFCSITFDDCFVVRDIRLVRGNKGVFVAMPSKILMDKCPRCSERNHLKAKYCNECGAALRRGRAERDSAGREKLFTDVAHPITPEFRSELHGIIIEAYKAELKAQGPPEPPSAELGNSPDAGSSEEA